VAQRFAAYERLVSTAADRMFGEAVTVVPKDAGEFVSVPDADRPSYQSYAIVDFNPEVVNVKSLGKTDGYYPDLSAETIDVSFNVQQLPPERKRWPRAGDNIVLDERVDRGRPITLKVSGMPRDDGIGRIVCACARVFDRS